LEEYVDGKRINPLIEYLASRSNLPGPRANLELADTLVDVVSKMPEGRGSEWWRLSEQFCEFTPERAPTNDPKEFLAFCGVRLLGAIVSSSIPESRVLARLREHAHDPRWRVRESVAMSVQALIEKHTGVLEKLEAWVTDEDWLGMRGVAAGVAEPRLMKKQGVPEQALRLHKRIIARFANAGDRGSEEFNALRKTLGYSLSVVVCGAPAEGFEYLRQLAASGNKHIQWIVRENLKKDRLTSRFPKEVASVVRAWPTDSHP
jgi:hypothetical protein